MAWRLARALDTLRSQVNKQFPNRSKNSDGSIGNAEHSARTSDHNPDDSGVVRAIDITHDPKGGFDSYAFADLMLKRQDPRLKYVISNRRIGSGPAGPSPGAWRKYTGANPHDHHCHISVVADARGDDSRLWDIEGAPKPTAGQAAAFVEPPATLRKGDQGPEVMHMQSRLNVNGSSLTVDGDFGPVTEAELREFQKGCGLVADGICGPMTWAALNKTVTRA